MNILNLINILFLPVFFFIGLVTSYEDIKFGKIKNKWIVLGLSWGLGVLALFLIWYFVAGPVTRFYYFSILHWPSGTPVMVVTVNLPFLFKALANFLVALLVGFLMWRFNAWAAGDAKLFAAYSLLIPLFFYQGAYFFIWPSFVLLINIFCIFLLYLFFNAVFYFLGLIWNRVKRKNNQLVNQPVSPAGEGLAVAAGKFLKQSIASLAMPLAVMLLFYAIQVPLRRLVVDTGSVQQILFAVLILFSKPMSKLYKKKLFMGLMTLALVSLVGYLLSKDFSLGANIIWQAARATIVFMIIMILFQRLVEFYINKTQKIKIKTGDLRAGMLVGSGLAARFGQLGEISFRSGGLSDEQVAIIRETAQDKKTEEVEIYKNSFFAVWIFIGALATIVLKQSLFGLLFGLIKFN